MAEQPIEFTPLVPKAKEIQFEIEKASKFDKLVGKLFTGKGPKGIAEIGFASEDKARKDLYLAVNEGETSRRGERATQRIKDSLAQWRNDGGWGRYVGSKGEKAKAMVAGGGRVVGLANIASGILAGAREIAQGVGLAPESSPTPFLQHLLELGDKLPQLEASVVGNLANHINTAWPAEMVQQAHEMITNLTQNIQTGTGPETAVAAFALGVPLTFLSGRFFRGFIKRIEYAKETGYQLGKEFPQTAGETQGPLGRLQTLRNLVQAE